MKFTIERSMLSDALNNAKRAVSARNTMPVLSHVLIETGADTLTITATDLDTSIAVKVPCNVAEAGAVAIPAAALADYVSKLPDAPITFEAKIVNANESVDSAIADAIADKFTFIATKLVIRCGKSRYTLGTMPAEDFPAVPVVTEGETLTLPCARLKEMIRLTAFSASKEESRSLLMGVLVEVRGIGLNLVATDTHRLAKMSEELSAAIEPWISAVIPAKPLASVSDMLPAKGDESATMRIGKSQVQFEFGNVTVVSRVMDGQFPNYEKVIPQTTERKATFDRGEMLNALRRIDIVSRNISQKVIANFADGTVTLQAESPDAGQAFEEVFIAWEGEALQIAFNAKYLLELLGMIPDDEIELRLNGSLQPGVIYVANGFSYIVMPMQA